MAVRRITAVLLLLAWPAAADEFEVMMGQLQQGRLAAALATAKSVLARGPDKEIETLQGVARRLLVARTRQREKGYRASLDYLEGQLDHFLMADAYGEAARWAGEEERALATLRKSELPLAFRIRAELHLLQMLQRWAELERRALEASRTVDWDLLPRWAAIAHEEVKLRTRLHERGARAIWVSVVALALLLGGCGVVWRLAPG